MRALTLLLFAAVVGCGAGTDADETKRTPVGSWGQWNAENDGGSPDSSAEFDYVYVFDANGTYTMTAGATTSSGTWRKSGDTIKLDNGATLFMEGERRMEGTTLSGTSVVLHRM